MTTRQRIDQNATANGWTRDVGDRRTTYTRDDRQLVVFWTPTGRVSGWEVLDKDAEIGRPVVRRVGDASGTDKRAAVIAELAR